MIESFLNFITNSISIFTQYSKENPILAGAISLWGLGVVSYFTRNIPNRIWKFIVKQYSTKLTIVSTSEAFYNFLVWYNKNGYGKYLRSFKINSGRWGDEDVATKSIGYGTHFFMYGIRPGIINLQSQAVENARSSMERDIIEITMLGRSRKVFDYIFEEIKQKNSRKGEFVVFRYNGEYWARTIPQIKRNLNTVFLKKDTKENLLEFITNFKSRESWYISHGLSYQTGFLLYGPPGCGKTSFVKAIASHFDMNLYILPMSHFHSIGHALFEIPNHSIVLIEDIDTDLAVSKSDSFLDSKKVIETERPTSGKSIKPAEPSSKKSFTFTSFSDVLNAIDGIISSHGRIIVATTNHIEKLDPALIRNGRFDLKIEVDYADIDVVKQFFKVYYPDFKFPSWFEVKSNLSAADIQATILKNLNNPNNVLMQIRDESLPCNISIIR
jgi:chaperone BCS1